MKKFILVAAAMMIALSASAQMHVGVKGGLNLSTANGITSDNDVKMPIHVGGNGGLVVDLPIISNLGVRAEALYSYQGYNLKNDNFSYAAHLGYVEVPLMLEYKFLDGNIALMVGPQFGYNTNANYKQVLSVGSVSTTTTGKVDNVSKFDFSIAVGATFMLLDNFGLDVRYNVGLSNIYPEDDLTIGSMNFGHTDAFGKQGVFQIGAVYYFL